MLHHILNFDSFNILRDNLAFVGDRARGGAPSSEADATNIVTLVAYGPYRWAEVFLALVTPELGQERLGEIWLLIFWPLCVLRHLQSVENSRVEREETLPTLRSS